MKKAFCFVISMMFFAAVLCGCGNNAPTAQREETSASAQSDELLVSSCRQLGFEVDGLMCDQLILVRADGTDALIDCFERLGGVFVPVNGLAGLTGYVGKNGVSADKREGDDATPQGVFTISYAFGIAEKPETALDYRNVNENCYFVDDMESMYYNQFVETEDTSSFTSSEHLIDFPERYKYAVVIEYNTSPVVPGNGSAIFLQCGGGETSGGIATSEENLLAIMKWLDPEKAPGIVIK